MCVHVYNVEEPSRHQLMCWLPLFWPMRRGRTSGRGRNGLGQGGDGCVWLWGCVGVCGVGWVGVGWGVRSRHGCIRMMKEGDWGGRGEGAAQGERCECMFHLGEESVWVHFQAPQDAPPAAVGLGDLVPFLAARVIVVT